MLSHKKEGNGRYKVEKSQNGLLNYPDSLVKYNFIIIIYIIYDID